MTYSLQPSAPCNTVYTQAAIDHLRRIGHAINHTNIERLPPLGRDHINLRATPSAPATATDNSDPSAPNPVFCSVTTQTPEMARIDREALDLDEHPVDLNKTVTGILQRYGLDRSNSRPTAGEVEILADPVPLQSFPGLVKQRDFSTIRWDLHIDTNHEVSSPGQDRSDTNPPVMSVAVLTARRASGGDGWAVSAN